MLMPIFNTKLYTRLDTYQFMSSSGEVEFDHDRG